MADKKYDYIIIGAGTAGCILANRLSADGKSSVLILEAGGPNRTLEEKIPAAFYKQFKTKRDWNYYTEPQPHMNGRSLYWPRGKAFGGSSAINAMIYIRGNRRDYDHWAELGNEGWSFEDVLPYFRKSENFEGGADLYHGAGGPINVVTHRHPNALTEVFVDAATRLGFPHNPDFNRAEQEGFGRLHVNQKNGERQSAADAFLRPVLKRPNLTAVPYATASHVIMHGKTAVGVEYMHENQLKQVYGKEIILSGGAINSPQLLMLSGIGPAEHLTEMDIPVVMDLPGVGQNLQDHLAIPYIVHSTQPVTLDGADTLKNIATFLLFHRGPLTSNIAEGTGFVKTDPSYEMPDVQFHFGPAYFMDHGQTKMKGHGISIGPTLLHPESRGAIELQSSYPFAPPRIQPNYYEAERDLRSMVEGLKLAREIMNQSPFDPFRGQEFLPGQDVQTDEQWREYVRQRSETLYHPVGTCKMGRDPMAVVDETLHVHGVHGLRVVDASIMPTIIGGNTNAPVMMIAEKAADMLHTQVSTRSAMLATA